MVVEWFYTTNKQQMGPVSWQELVELAQGGILKPHDLVWTEGMNEWVKAIHQHGLFVDPEEASGRPVKKSAYTKPKPPPGRRTGRRDEDEDDDEEDEREKRKKARKREEDRARTGVGIKVGLILAGIVFVLLLLACGGGLLVWISFSGGKGNVVAKDGARPPINPNPGGQPPPPAPPPINNPGQGGALVGTNWNGSETLRNFNRLNFRFQDNNQVAMTDAEGVTNGTWTQNGNGITLRFFNNSVTYSGILTGNRMQGSATNGKDRWNWTVTRGN